MTFHSYLMEVVQEGHKLTVTGNEDTENRDVSIHVEVPIVYDVNVVTSGNGDIHCKDMSVNNKK